MTTSNPSPLGSPERPLRICLFGTYDRVAHPRIVILKSALRAAGAEVVEAHVPGWSGGTEEKLRTAAKPLQPSTLLRLLGTWIGLTRRYRRIGPHDVVLVGYFGHLDVHLARLLAGRHCPVVLDMFLSVYDTVVLDRATVAPGSLPARLCRLVDQRAVRTSRLALLDTEAQVEFCTHVLDIPESKLAVIPVGAEPDRFPPRPLPGGAPLRVLFYGSFIPLHGTRTLAAAIRLLHGTPVVFTVVGRGQERLAFDRGMDGVSGVTVVDWVDYDRLGELIAAHHVVLGVFGTSDKASRVVPNKVYQAACAGRAIVTADTPATRAAFADGEVALVPPGDAEALAAVLHDLAADRERVTELGRRARARFEQDYAPGPLGRRLSAILQETTRMESSTGDTATAKLRADGEWVPPPRFLLRLDLVRRLLPRLDKEQPVLELGFGAGGMLEELARQGFRSVIGTDFSASAVRNATQRLGHLPAERRPRLLQASLDVFDPDRVQFGAILAFEVLEHVEDDKGLLHQAHDLLQPDGWMLVSVPAHQRLFSAVDASVGHYRRYERDELRRRFLEAGFEIETFWCYGYPLANMLDAVRRRITDPLEPGSPEALAMRSAESGNVVPARGLVKLLVRPATMAPFLGLQRLFLNGDQGPGYIVLARKAASPPRDPGKTPGAVEAISRGEHP